MFHQVFVVRDKERGLDGRRGSAAVRLCPLGKNGGVGQTALNRRGVTISDGFGEKGLRRGIADLVAQLLHKSRCTVLLRNEYQAGLGAELAGAQGKGGLQLSGNGASPLLQGPGQNEYRVYASHLGVARDRLRACGSQLHEGGPAGKGPGKRYCLDCRVFDELNTHIDTGIEEHGKYAFRKAARLDALANGLAD